MATKKPGAQLKTIADWRRWLDYRDGSDASGAGVHRTSKGVVDQARRLVVRAYRYKQWGLPGGDYRAAAARLTQAGYPTTEQDFKNAGRAKGSLTEQLIPADAPGIAEFVKTVSSIWLAFDWQRLVKGEIENLRSRPKAAQVIHLPIDSPSHTRARSGPTATPREG
jgi:hypothetical protein